LVQRALDARLAGLRHLGDRLLRGLGHHHLLGRAHHRADRGGLGLGLAAAVLQVAGTGGFLVGARLRFGNGLLAGFGGGLVARFGLGLGNGLGSFRFGGLGGAGAGLLGGIRLGALFGFLLGDGTGLFGRAGARFLFLALAALGSQLFFLAADQLGLAAGFLLAPGELGIVGAGWLRRLGDFGRFHHGGVTAFVSLDEGALLA